MASTWAAERTIGIWPDGTIRYIYSDDLADLSECGKATITRASNVEPVEGGWQADMVGGPRLGVHRLRRDALAEEVRWLNENLIQS